MEDKRTNFTMDTMAEYKNGSPAGYEVAQKASVPLDFTHVQADAQINKWGVISPEDDPRNVAEKAYGAIADNKQTFSQETSPGTESLINLNTNKWGEIDEKDTLEW